MKRNENRKNRNWRNFVVLTLVCMLAVTLVGCKTSTAVTPEPSTSEVVSEPASEPVSEEVSEPVSEEPSEEVVSEEVSEPEIIDGVQMVYCESYEEMEPYFEGLENAVVVVFKFSVAEKGQAILYNGAHYTMEENFFMRIQSPKAVEYINSDAEYVRIVTQQDGEEIQFIMKVETTGTDIEVPITIKYTDGTEEILTVYITKDW